MLNPLAQELNDILKGTAAYDLFSDVGQRMYFPKGIIAQSAEAKKSATLGNGTIGMALVNGVPAMLPSVEKNLPHFTPQELVAYAPTAGLPDLREEWKKKIIEKNPKLQNKKISTPIVVPGLTAGISYVADLFVDSKKPLIIANPSWDNYVLIAEARRNAKCNQFNMFENGKFNIKGIEDALIKDAKKYGSARLLLNFPQNPSGYSPTHKEVAELVKIIKELAENGNKLLVISDDAYFGLDYEENIEKQSLFAYIANIHENVLAIKSDGPTKEDFAWGFRMGFVTFASKNMKDTQYDALTKKFMGTIRSSVSCAATPSQSILHHAFSDPAHDEQKAYFRSMLERRYREVRKFVDSHTSKVITPLPFNSGYFMSFHTKCDSELLRQKLLNEKGIGTISINPETLRVAFSSIDEEKIENVYKIIYEVAETFAK